MRQRVDIHAESGLAVLADESVRLEPPDLGSNAFRRYYVDLARGGQAFFLDGEDPRDFKLLVTVGEDPTELPAHRRAPLGGSYGLTVGSGTLVVSDGWSEEGRTSLSIPPGSYSLRVLGPDMEVFDSRAYQEEQSRAVGERDWRFKSRVERLGLIGCVPFVAMWVVILIYQWSLVSLAALAVGVGSMLPGYFMTKTARYQRIERRLKEMESSYPTYVLRLEPVTSLEGLPGGHFVTG